MFAINVNSSNTRSVDNNNRRVLRNKVMRSNVRADGVADVDAVEAAAAENALPFNRMRLRRPPHQARHHAKAAAVASDAFVAGVAAVAAEIRAAAVRRARRAASELEQHRQPSFD